MPYVRRRRNYRRSRYGRRRVLSTRNIYTKRSSLAQATQIAALRRRVNKVYKSCKPEMKTALATNDIFSFSSNTGSYVFKWVHPPTINIGAGDHDRVGNKIRCREMYAFTAEYYNNSSTGYHDSESSGVQIRVIMIQHKTQANQVDAPDPSNILANWGTSGTNYSAAAVTPFVDNVTEKYKIIKEKRYFLTSARNQMQIKISSPWYTCRFADNGYSNHCQVLIVVCGLHWDTNFTEWVQMARIAKVFYTDA